MAILQANNIAFSYVSGNPVLQRINFKAESGERVALQAESGRGKSTLCQILAGYLKPDEGEVTLDGEPVQASPGKPTPVQLIWQHPEHSVDPHLRVASSLEEAGSIPDDLMRNMGIKSEWLARFPHELSGGELQRICIARALATSPRFIVADEISTMLDAITQATLWNFLLDHCSKNEIGLVLVTHSRALQDRLATRVVTLDDASAPIKA